MIVCPILIVALMLPWLPLATPLPAAVWMALLTLGCWGIAARRPNYRWVLVFSPFATEVVSILYTSITIKSINM